MTPSQAQAYIDRTNWYELRKYVTGDPVPDGIARKREEAYRVLQKAE